MGSDNERYFREDIQNVIDSVEVAGRLPPHLGEANDYPAIQSYAVGYTDGYRKALLAVGLAFGLQPVAMLCDWAGRGEAP